MKFKEGKKVRVIGNTCGHHYEIGSTVTMYVDFSNNEFIGAEMVKGLRRYIKYSDVEEIEENTLSKDRIKQMVKPVEDYLNTIIEKAKIDLSQLESPIINDVKKFETIGVFTQSQSFFSDIIKNHDGEKLKLFVMVREEKHLKGHEFDFIVLDSESGNSKELFDAYHKNK